MTKLTRPDKYPVVLELLAEFEKVPSDEFLTELFDLIRTYAGITKADLIVREPYTRDLLKESF